MIELGPLLVFLVAVSIVITYVLIVRWFIRQDETPEAKPLTEPAREKDKGAKKNAELSEAWSV